MAETNDQLQGMDGDGGENSWYLDSRIKRLLLDLQKHWMVDYENSREKALVQMTETLHQEFLAEQKRMKEELVAQFQGRTRNQSNSFVWANKAHLEQQHQEKLESELQQAAVRFEAQIEATKRKQWCTNCSLEAIYHCCWNCAYCSPACQQAHWPTHRRLCRRRTSRNNNGNNR
ncbi:MYND finger [Aphelenchoides fujianensis]|nr:MYND finger [Aphelenchoides fujianensis]